VAFAVVAEEDAAQSIAGRYDLVHLARDVPLPVVEAGEPRLDPHGERELHAAGALPAPFRRDGRVAAHAEDGERRGLLYEEPARELDHERRVHAQARDRARVED